jgi:hypothetical protein
MERLAKKHEYLPTSAIAVAPQFTSTHKRYNQWYGEAYKPKPRENDIEKAKSEICGRHYPHIIIPMLCFLFHAASSSFERSTRVIIAAGHASTHNPQPTHLSISITE